MNDQVLNEFIDDWNAGRRPRVRDYLARLPDGPERDALADTLTDWLSVAPTPAYTDADRRAIRAEPVVARVLDSPLGGLRERAGLSVRELAASVARSFGLADVERTARYLSRLEAGELDPGRVSRRLLDALGGLLGASVDDSAALGRALASGRRHAVPGGQRG